MNEWTILIYDDLIYSDTNQSIDRSIPVLPPRLFKNDNPKIHIAMHISKLQQIDRIESMNET
ncbi:hypothetical protein DERP_013263 [Dermatophagoides pteronyssinus]|uniref:Uncharacterized protein n=1 Tax=Dermatophagoides pteronyssinus TaxID=6956 RepID=A0ABQ8IRJ7_DERPT|nr:hypothetical protein DERP_013263 [Dermatophagoides pteronyssinus]